MNQDLKNVIREIKFRRELTQAQIAAELGIKAPYLSDVVNGRVPYSDNLRKKIYELYSDCITLTGEGQMLKTLRNGVIEITPEAIHEGDYSGTLVYNIDAVCGTDTRDIEFTEDRIIGSVKLPEIKRTSHIITATGDSMEPVIRNGDRIAVREIGSWDMIVYGQIYMVLTDEYRLLKYIRRHKTDPENMIILRSANPDYDDIDLKRSKIRKLFIVENVIAVKNIL